MNDNYIPTGRYCYQIGNHYACTDDEKMASVYFGIRLLEKMGQEFVRDMIELTNDFIKWAESNRMEKSAEAGKVFDRISDANEVVNRNARNPELKDNFRAMYEEAYEIMVSVVPLLMDAEEALKNRPKVEPDKTPRRLAEIRNSLKPYEDDIFSENIALFREAWEIIKMYPDAAEGCYSDEEEKVALLMSMAEKVKEPDCARLIIEIRTYIDDYFKSAPQEVQEKNQEAIARNLRLLDKRKDYIDEGMTVEEYVKKYNVDLLFDPFLRTRKWEEIASQVFQAVKNSIPSPDHFGDNLYALTVLFQRMVLNQNGFRFKDEIQLNLQSPYRRFFFTVNGNDYQTDYFELYDFYFNAAYLTDRNSMYFDLAIDAMHKQLILWMRSLKIEKAINKAECDDIMEWADRLEEAKQVYKENPEDFETPIEMCMECLNEIFDLEYNIRYSEPGRQRRQIMREACRIEILDENGGCMDEDRKARKKKALDEMKNLCDAYESQHDLYLDWAFLKTCDDWSTYISDRPDEFRENILIAIEKYNGLSPDRYLDWAVMLNVLTKNPDFLPMDDMDRFNDLTLTAIEQGPQDISDLATEVFNIIWEPEDIIEED